MLLAVTRIPARTGFRLTAPTCDTALTLENLALSLTKVPHIVLFGAFSLIRLKATAMRHSREAHRRRSG
jgi:hypothetical protein